MLNVFFFNDTATTEIYTLSLHDALPIYIGYPDLQDELTVLREQRGSSGPDKLEPVVSSEDMIRWQDRKSTRLNSSHSQISYAVFCLKKKKKPSNLAVL